MMMRWHDTIFSVDAGRDDRLRPQHDLLQVPLRGLGSAGDRWRDFVQIIFFAFARPSLSTQKPVKSRPTLTTGNVELWMASKKHESCTKWYYLQPCQQLGKLPGNKYSKIIATTAHMLLMIEIAVLNADAIFSWYEDTVRWMTMNVVICTQI